jgi:hypothetical protein
MLLPIFGSLHKQKKIRKKWKKRENTKTIEKILEENKKYILVRRI